MVLLKIVAILVFISFASRFIHPANWHPFAPNGWPGILTGGSIVFFTYIGFDSVSNRGRRMQEPKTRCSHRIMRLWRFCTILLSSGCGLDRTCAWQTLVDDAAPSSTR